MLATYLHIKMGVPPVIYMLLLWISSFCAVLANGPPYTLQCDRNKDCEVMGMRCYYDYPGCNIGVCACVYGSTAGGACVSKKEGDTCSSHDQCPSGLGCHDNRCTCMGEMIDNNKYCLKSYEVLLGQECGQGQSCLHRTEDGADYAGGEVTCKHGSCTCRPGLKKDGRTCRRIRPDEQGCITNADCSGDSVCKHKYCRCPEGNRKVTHNPPKCGKWNARTNIDEGQTCDEIIQKNKFCTSDLQCVRCGQEAGYRCRRYKSSRPQSVSSSPIHTPHTLLLVTSVLTILWCSTRPILMDS